MPGPKMGPRPADFDEAVIRQSPTFLKWLSLDTGEKMRYACREFVKGNGQDEERLMRRIMIARRNNLRDHEVLKRARKQNHHAVPAATATSASDLTMAEATVAALYPTSNEDNQDTSMILNDPGVPPFEGLNLAAISSNHLSDSVSVPSNPNSVTAAAVAPFSATLSTTAGGGVRSAGRRTTSNLNDQQVEREMDVAAVEATRSYRAWMELPEGREMIYNQKYVKGQPGHDWLLRKNIWRRMRYRRDCKRMVDALRTGGDEGMAAQADDQDGPSVVSQHLGGPASHVQSVPSQSANAASKRKTRSQVKRQKKDDIPPPHRESQHSHLNMDSMDDPHGSLNDAHESTSLDQMLDESTNKIVQSVKVGLLDAATLLTAADGSHGVGGQMLMTTETESIRLSHHHPMDGISDEDAVDQEAIEAAVAAAESFGKTAQILAESMASLQHHNHHNVPSVVVGQEHHHDHPLDTAALDAAAQLAAASALDQDGEDADAVAAATAAAVAASTSDLYETAVNMV